MKKDDKCLVCCYQSYCFCLHALHRILHGIHDYEDEAINALMDVWILAKRTKCCTHRLYNV